MANEKEKEKAAAEKAKADEAKTGDTNANGETVVAPGITQNQPLNQEPGPENPVMDSVPVTDDSVEALNTQEVIEQEQRDAHNEKIGKEENDLAIAEARLRGNDVTEAEKLEIRTNENTVHGALTTDDLPRNSEHQVPTNIRDIDNPKPKKKSDRPSLEELAAAEESRNKQLRLARTNYNQENKMHEVISEDGTIVGSGKTPELAMAEFTKHLGNLY